MNRKPTESLLKEWAEHVVAMCPGTTFSNALVDLSKTGSLEQTINRIFDGQFLEGTERDPSLVTIKHYMAQSDDLHQTPRQCHSTDCLDAILISDTPYPNSPTRKNSQKQPINYSKLADLAQSMMNDQDLVQNSVLIPSKRPEKIAAEKSGLLQNLGPTSPRSSQLINPTPYALTSPQLVQHIISLDSSDPDIINTHLLTQDTYHSSDCFEEECNAITPKAPPKQRHVFADLEFESSRAVYKNLKTDLALIPIAHMSPKLESEMTDMSSPPRIISKEHLTLKSLKENRSTGLKSSNSMSDETTLQKKETEKQAKQAERERRKTEKQQLKEAAEIERRILKQVQSSNKLRGKADCITEIIVEFSSEWETSSLGKFCIDAIQQCGAHSRIVDATVSGKIITWRRKTNRTWNEDLSLWDVRPTYISTEPYVLVLLTGKQLAELCITTALLRHFESLMTSYPGSHIIYLIEDLDAFYKQREKSHQAHYTRQIRSALIEANKSRAAIASTCNQNGELIGLNDLSSNQPPLSQNRMHSPIDDGLPCRKVVDEFLVRLQFTTKGRCYVHSTKSAETASWIVSYTEQIAFAPEQRHRSMTSLNMNFGDKVKTGKSASDSWQKALEQIPQVTSAKAAAICEKYPTFSKLMQAYAACDSKQKAESLLVGIKASGTGHAIGLSLSKQVSAVFCCTDGSELMK
ncbi:hypothetical protein BATDEDRAFT_87135 [Batrachochytrium dendrobatidis JAM81]|uniref:Uncharacterized protein n=1 Tax=Batrachochytrium dendrobatidis (strain JAM81 / FGSC 10211) TaxID=684364 RepID=F4NYV9_BATDJ|nr:uncharacterized protein BATDEDRAFT_87135 [Batrachochytrium dendrobatidis JAM81]EGF82095.1 hypothetical protein BATDEDRAFT_87135 [Batrachochytrium dendrobatidis JAM81]|eukprot:XP_006677635.1 hypothetical protein BATDEDRAFT_87135 [Batrachochytrium dendrobatidis JAM81]